MTQISQNKGRRARHFGNHSREPPCRRPTLITTNYLLFRGQDTRAPHSVFLFRDNGQKAVSRLNFGVYDPEGECQQADWITIEHLLISWVAYRPGDLLRQLGVIGSKGRRPLITINSWCDQAITSQPSEVKNTRRRIGGFADEVSWKRSPRGCNYETIGVLR